MLTRRTFIQAASAALAYLRLGPSARALPAPQLDAPPAPDPLPTGAAGGGLPILFDGMRLQLVTDAGGPVDVTAAFADLAGVAVSINRQATWINGPGASDVVCAPPAGTIRKVKNLYIRCVSPKAVAIELQCGDERAAHPLWKDKLHPSDALNYEEGIGWFRYEAARS